MTGDTTIDDSGDAAAAAVVAALAARIRAEIDDAGGWIPFARFMELALYAPGLGYYSAGAAKIGLDPRDGSDFVTAPERTPLFARALVAPLAAVLERAGGRVLELGAGTGALAADLLVALDEAGVLPARYEILEVSADLQARQRERLAARAPHLVDRVHWSRSLPERIDGVVVANEVLDAVPVELVVGDGIRWRRRGVVVDAAGFAFEDRADASDRSWAEGLPDAATLPPDYVTENHVAARALVAGIVGGMTEDALALFIDYGFPASEYYHPQRSGGTLMTHRHHRAGFDPLTDPGRQDITAHVDFSGVARAAITAGGQVAGYTAQAPFLIECGIAGLLAGSPDDPRAWAVQAQALQLLLSEAEMGELFKVIAFARRLRPVPGFGRDRRGQL